MAPASTTARVCSEVPEAMLVRAQAASNCRQGWSDDFRNSTSLGMSPTSTISFRGGFLSRDSNFLCSEKETKQNKKQKITEAQSHCYFPLKLKSSDSDLLLSTTELYCLPLITVRRVYCMLIWEELVKRAWKENGDEGQSTVSFRYSFLGSAHVPLFELYGKWSSTN